LAPSSLPPITACRAGILQKIPGLSLIVTFMSAADVHLVG